MTPSPIPLTISERDFQNTVIDYAKMRRWLVMHSRPAPVREGRWVTPIQGDAGYVDLTLARDGVVVFLELKRMGGRLTPAQKLWGQHLGGTYWVMYPSHWNDGTITGLLS